MPDKPKCFVMMPISTPESYIKDGFRPDHFRDILIHLHSPAIEKAGYEVVSPISTGSEIIHGDIIQNISECDFVLCDMSGLNPNVFFEFGIRCALNLPVALVVDDLTKKIPFDAGMINRHTYLSKPEFKLNSEIDKLAKHLTDSVEKSDNQNTLWKRFGISQVGNFNPENTSDSEKLDFIINSLGIRKHGMNHFLDENVPPNWSVIFESYLEPLDSARIRDFGTMSKSTIISELDMNFGELHEIKNQEDRYDTFIRVLSKIMKNKDFF